MVRQAHHNVVRLSSPPLEKRLFLFTDGASRGNPGPSAAGVILKDQEGKILLEKSQFLGRMTNNEAEYRALALGLSLAKEFKPTTIVCVLDSELVVSQLKGIYRVKKPHLAMLVQEVRQVERLYPKVIYKAVTRDKNEPADKLANKALKGRN